MLSTDNAVFSNQNSTCNFNNTTNFWNDAVFDTILDNKLSEFTMLTKFGISTILFYGCQTDILSFCFLVLLSHNVLIFSLPEVVHHDWSILLLCIITYFWKKYRVISKINWNVYLLGIILVLHIQFNRKWVLS